MLEQPRGILKASVPIDFAIIYMAPILVEFAERYPNIYVELDMTPQQVDLISKDVDVAIRIGNLSNSTLISRKLMEVKAQLFASPHYLKARGSPKHPEELGCYDCITFPKTNEWTLVNGKEFHSAQVGGRFVVNSIGMMKRLFILNQGIILIPASTIDVEIKNNQLKAVLKDWFSLPVSVYAITETRLIPAKIRVFIDFLKEKLAAY